MTRNDPAAVARKIADRAAASSATPPAVAGRPVVRTRPVRLTADLSPGAYRALTQLGQDLAEQTGRARVPHVEIVRALIDELAEDGELRARVARRLAP